MKKSVSALLAAAGFCACLAMAVVSQGMIARAAMQPNAATVQQDPGAETAAYRMTEKLFQQRKPGMNLIFSPYSMQQMLSLIDGSTSQEETQQELAPYLVRGIDREKLDNTKTGSLILLDKKLAGHAVRRNSAGFRLVEYPDGALQAKEAFQKEILGSVIDTEAPKKNLTFLTAAHYYAEWATKFDKTQTAERPFTTELGQTVSVMTMKQQFSGGQGKITPEYEMAAVPGRNHSVVYFIKPKTDRNRTAGELGTIIADFEQGKDTVHGIDLEVPKLSVRNKIDLKQLLQALQMDSFFTGVRFDRITGRVPYVLAEASQTATLDINEDYAEGKAVTEIGFRTMAAPVNPKIHTIKMDSPYFIVIRDQTETGIDRVVFTAWIANPAQ